MFNKQQNQTPFFKFNKSHQDHKSSNPLMSTSLHNSQISGSQKNLIISPLKKQFNNLKEIYSLLNLVQIDKEKFYPNIVITGHQNSGKTSLIEYLTSLELFPRSVFTKKSGNYPNPPMRIKITNINCDSNLSTSQGDDFITDTILNTKKLYNNQNKTVNFSKGYKISLNDEFNFTDLEDFRRHINDNGIEENNDNFISITIEIHNSNSSSDNLNLFNSPFDCTIYEIDLSYLERLKNVLPADNSMIILCNACDKEEILKSSLENLKRVQDENILVVMTKPDKIENINHLHNLYKILSENKTPYTLTKLRTNQDKECYDLVEFYSLEHKFYEENHIFKKGGDKSDQYGINTLLELVCESIINLFNKNFDENKNNLKQLIENNLTDLQMIGMEIPANNLDKKSEILKRKFKTLINFMKNMCDYNCDILETFIQTGIFSLPSSENVCNNSNMYKNLINTYTENLNIDLHSFERKAGMSIKELKEKLFKLCKNKLEEENDMICSVFESIIENNKIYLQNKIQNLFKTSNDELIDMINNYFSEIVSKYQAACVDSLLPFIQTEIASNFLEEIELDKILIEIVKKEHQSNEIEQLASEYIEKFCKIKIKTLMTIRAKFYYHNVYLNIKHVMSDISTDEIIKDTIENVNYYTEKEESKFERNQLKRNGNNFIRILEMMYKYNNSLTSGSSSQLNASNLYRDKSNIQISGHYQNLQNVHNIQNSTLNLTISRSKNVSTKTEIEKYKSRLNNLMTVFQEDCDKFEEYNLDELDHIEQYGESPLQHEEDILKNIGDLQPHIDNFGDIFKKEKLESEYINQEKINLQQLSTEGSRKGTNQSAGLNYNKEKYSYHFSSFSREKEIVMIWDSTNCISVYDSERNKISYEYVKDIPNSIFMEDNRYINIGNSVFMCGGCDSKKVKQSLCLILTRPDNKIHRLKDVPQPVIRHSLITIENSHILLVGGKENLNSFVYDLNEDIWMNAGRLNTERIDPSLILINGNIVVCFGGIKEKEKRIGDYLAEAKYFNMKNLESDWTPIRIKSQDNIIERLSFVSGLGLLPTEDKFCLLGGYNLETFEDEEKTYEIAIENKDSINHIELQNNSDYLSSFNLVVKENTSLKGKDIQSWFLENNFYKFQNGFANFNVDGEILKFSLEGITEQVIPCDYVNNTETTK